MSFVNDHSPDVDLAQDAMASGGNFFADSKADKEKDNIVLVEEKLKGTSFKGVWSEYIRIFAQKLHEVHHPAGSNRRHADLNAMLDSNKDNLKMDAMKRIINMMAKGRDVSDLFPAVVKNVAAKNVEVKKLVYVYLVRYAEEQQDLALLSISTFQRALKDPNQLIRASALRVLSSIRVQMIAPILMLAIKESARDMSPYVRKVAAHAIPKLYSLEPDLKEQLIEILDYLLADRTTLVVGSAMYAFTEVCPDRMQLMHKHFRKICSILMDVDEWGQVIIVNTLTRYARENFPNPNEDDEEEAQVQKHSESKSDKSGSESDVSDTTSEASEESTRQVKRREMDPDLRLLLKNAKALLQSRNSAVVLAVAQLYYHCAPYNEMGIIAKALIRLLRSHREVQSVVLINIATISAARRIYTNIYAISKNVFEPFLKSFFVRSCDPTHIKLLKLEILTNLATQSNISIILRDFEFLTYVHMHDKEFAAAAIDAIGRCAANINEVTDVCLSGLVGLMSSRNETVVAQSVVVIKRLLQRQPNEHTDIIVRMTRLLDSVRVAVARASIVALVGDYCEMVPKVAPDVLRKMCKTFIFEENIVKLQVLNLAVRLYLTNREQCAQLVQYAFTLARYDKSYDLRDRARFLRNLVLNDEKPNKLSQFAKQVFLTQKPAPVLESIFKDRDQYQLGTLSHYLNQRCAGYTDLAPFTEEGTDSDLRNVEGYDIPTAAELQTPLGESRAFVAPRVEQPAHTLSKFYSDVESDEEAESSSSDSETEDSSGSSGTSGSDSEDKSESSSNSESEEAVEEKPKQQKKKVAVAEKKPVETVKKPPKKETKPEKKTTDLLLDLDFGAEAPASEASSKPIMLQPGSMLKPATEPIATVVPKTTGAKGKMEKDVGELVTAPAQHVPTRTTELLSRHVGHGLTIHARYTRSPSTYGATMVSVELQLSNESDTTFDEIHLVDKKLESGMTFAGLLSTMHIGAKKSSTAMCGVDFGDTTQAVTLTLCVKAGDDERRHVIAITAPVGEQLEPLLVTQNQFKILHARLSGLCETSGRVTLKESLSLSTDSKAIDSIVYDLANVIQISQTEEKICYAGRTMSGKCPVLISLAEKDNECKITVNTEKMVIGSMLYKQLKEALS